MIRHINISATGLFRSIKNRHICFGGNERLKIYGRLNCASGKRMKKANRVFFHDEQEAISLGYRPCGHCMKEAYRKGKEKVN